MNDNKEGLLFLITVKLLEIMLVSLNYFIIEKKGPFLLESR